MHNGDHGFGTKNDMQYFIHRNMSLRQEHQTLRLNPTINIRVMQILLKNNNNETAKCKSFQTESNCSLITRV